MKKFRQFKAASVLAVCAMLTLSACTDEITETIGIGSPAISLEAPIVNRAGIVIPIKTTNASDINYAALFKAADATTDPIPEASDYKSISVKNLTDGMLRISADELSEFGTYCIYVYADNFLETGKPEMIQVSYTEENFDKLLTCEAKNLSPFTLDVAVTMSDMCDKYVVTILPKADDGIGDDGAAGDQLVDFTDAARRSINPDEDQILYGMQAFEVQSASAVIPESRLSKNTKYDSQECVGFIPVRVTGESSTPLKYVVASYGIDKFGNEEVVISEAFTLPEAVYLSASDPTVTITPTTTLTKSAAGFKAPETYAKIVYGSMPEINSGSAIQTNEETWKDRAGAIELLKSLPLTAAPMANWATQPYKNHRDMPGIGKPTEKVVIYAFGVTKDGKIGPIDYTLATYKTPMLNGTATLQSIKACPHFEGFKLSLFWDVVTSPETTAVRFMVMPKGRVLDPSGGGTDGFDMMFTGTPEKEMELTWMMCTDESKDGYGTWKELTVQELKQLNYTYSYEAVWYETEYVIRAVARDGAGKWGEIYVGPNQTTTKAPVVDNSIDFSKGTGKITVNISSMVYDSPANPDASDVVYTVSKGANTEATYVINVGEDRDYRKLADFTYDNLRATANRTMDKLTIQEWPAERTIVFGKEYSELDGLFMKPSSWGTGYHLFVTKDTSGNYKIAAVIVAGEAQPIYFN